jgi:hypothetical protein
MMAFDFDSLGVELEENKEAPRIKGVVDIIFLIDVSGSMAPAIRELIDNIDSFVDNIDPRKVRDYRIKIGSFSDIDVDIPQVAMNLDRPWRANPKTTQSTHLIKNDLQECVDLVETYYGGGDEPESSLEAISRAVDMFDDDWTKRTKVIVLFTDATTKPLLIDGLSEGESLVDLANRIQEKHVNLFLYAPVHEYYQTLSQEALDRITYEAINEDGSSPVDALRGLDFKRVLEVLGKTVSQASVV